MSLEPAAYLTLLAPLIGALIIALGGMRIPERVSGLISCTAVFIGFIGAIAALLRWNSDKADHGMLLTPWTWLSSGHFRIGLDLFVDPLTIWMMLVVTGVGFLIHVYSLGYMAHDPQFRRFFAYLNIFIFAMLMLVMAGNFVMLTVGWGLVGMASYLLIGFWHDRPTAVAAAKKAFIINAIGDVALMLGLILIFRETGVLDYPSVFAQWPIAVGSNDSLAFVGAALLLVGALAKSAQLPLHTWLPDAMEGPTPVSALIHAATMVTAGVYLVARMHPIFDLSVAARDLTALIGAVTLVVAGFIALAQTDIKRIIAYSTMSQIGYMFIAVGIGANTAAMFHLATHAFFKALLFLGSGIVIHALAEEQDIRLMGGLRKYMPKTYGVFLVGTLALVGIIPFAGFWSKDEILSFALASGNVYGWVGYTVYGLGMLGALLTGIYSFRLIFLVFHGEESELVAKYGRGELMHHGHATNAHGEAPRTMAWPVYVLAALSVVGGLLVVPGSWNHVADFLHQAHAAPVREQLELVEFGASKIWLLSLASMAVGIIGIIVALLVWQRGTWRGLRTRMPTSERFLQHAMGFDALYDRVISRPAAGIAAGLRITEDEVVVPSMGWITTMMKTLGIGIGRTQNGLVRLYAAGTIAAVVIIVAIYVVVGS